jgi:hypothetical protein
MVTALLRILQDGHRPRFKAEVEKGTSVECKYGDTVAEAINRIKILDGSEEVHVHQTSHELRQEARIALMEKFRRYTP